MPIINITNCPICNSSKTSKVFDAVDHFSTRETFPTNDCKSCGFRFTNNFPSEDSIGRYYDSPDYISHSNSKTGLINRLYHFFRKQMLKKVNLVKYVVPRQKDNIHILILAQYGYFLNAAKEEVTQLQG